jgi:geranylgeranyl diphosphate synthase type I
MNKHKDAFDDYGEKTDKRIREYLRNSREVRRYFAPKDIRNSVWSYIKKIKGKNAKRLRPSVLLLACGCLGGKEREELAVPAAAGVEVFHTWTLVHDDLIDNDTQRRDRPTVHAGIEAKVQKILGTKSAKDYGRDIAVLTGDMQHGWSVTCFLDCFLKHGVNPRVVIEIVHRLQSQVLGQLIEGETLDVQFGLMNPAEDVLKLSEKQIEKMLWLKTGVLYEFAGWAGALIGRNEFCPDDKEVVSIQKFASNCGTAFQLIDDILGVVGTDIGKPVGSDIREGKKTLIVHEAWKNANESQREKMRPILGNKNASKAQIKVVQDLFVDLGGIERTKARADHYLKEALEMLEHVPQNHYRDLLKLWAKHMIDREF